VYLGVSHIVRVDPSDATTLRVQAMDEDLPEGKREGKIGEG
jgi:hypothetical protein